jgi:hypothetical protein
MLKPTKIVKKSLEDRTKKDKVMKKVKEQIKALKKQQETTEQKRPQQQSTAEFLNMTFTILHHLKEISHYSIRHQIKRGTPKTASSRVGERAKHAQARPLLTFNYSHYFIRHQAQRGTPQTASLRVGERAQSAQGACARFPLQ